MCEFHSDGSRLSEHSLSGGRAGFTAPADLSICGCFSFGPKSWWLERIHRPHRYAVRECAAIESTPCRLARAAPMIVGGWRVRLNWEAKRSTEGIHALATDGGHLLWSLGDRGGLCPGGPRADRRRHFRDSDSECAVLRH